MATDSDTFVFIEPGMRFTFQDWDGPIGKHLIRGGTRVQLAARRQVGKRTHLLERNIVKRQARGRAGQGAGRAGDLIMMVGSWQRDYALLHHEGSRPHMIRPRRPNGALRFMKDGKVIFAKIVHHPGTKPNRYLSDNLRLAVR